MQIVPSFQSPKSPGLQNPGPPCRRTDTPPRYEAPRSQDAPSPLTAGRGTPQRISLEREHVIYCIIRQILICTQGVLTEQSRTSSPWQPHKTQRSPASLLSGIVLFTISFCFSSGSAGERQGVTKGSRKTTHNKVQRNSVLSYEKAVGGNAKVQRKNNTYK